MVPGHAGAAVAIMIGGVYLLGQSAGRAGDLTEYAPLHIVQDCAGVSGSVCGPGG